MKIPTHLLVRSAIATAVTSVEHEAGVYVVEILFDGVREVFHIELEGKASSFNVREGSYYKYCQRCPDLKGIVALMRQIHRGERFDFPVDLAHVDFV